ncbi:MAG: zinc ribbon domain-containing protein [Clostridia bacterium]|nr:zinc ribbon domain-containing protein [Clostridia bacterium]
MKCPECGQWNRASMPHCIKCGAPLNIDGASKLQWKDTLKDSGPSTAYLRADEFGQVDSTPDSRDQLAGEMQELKKRKHEGAERQRRLSKTTASRPEPEVVVTEDSAEYTRRVRRVEEPVTAIRVQPVSRNEKARREQSELWNRVRFMDENGAFVESHTYDPVPSGGYGYSQGTGSWHLAGPLSKTIVPDPEKKRGILKILLMLLVVALLGAGGFFGYRYLASQSRPEYNKDAIITASLQDDLPSHTILIPGEEGTTIYIRELHASYVVMDGFATIVVADHTWYDNLDGALDESMDVTMTPFLKTASGKQTPLPLITYPITIPISPISLENPEGLYKEVSTTMYSIRFTVRPDSRVTINGLDYSDVVNDDTGEVIYNAPVHPKGKNTYDITVRSRYCRENTITVVLYREEQEIPLDLAVGTIGSTDKNVMKVTATTLPGSEVHIISDHSDFDITDLNKTGRFSFIAIFKEIGENTITITSSREGMKTSVVNHKVYYVPRPEEYTPKAWALTPEGYSELLNNIKVRAEKHQIYVAKGIVKEIINEKPLRVVINTSEDGKSQPVVLERPEQSQDKIHWEVGKYYRVYADVSNVYDNMPVLIARYSYDK